MITDLEKLANDYADAGMISVAAYIGRAIRDGVAAEVIVRKAEHRAELRRKEAATIAASEAKAARWHAKRGTSALVAEAKERAAGNY